MTGSPRAWPPNIEDRHLKRAVGSLAAPSFAVANECPPSPDERPKEERGDQREPLALVTLSVELDREREGVDCDDRAPSHASGHARDSRRTRLGVSQNVRASSMRRNSTYRLRRPSGRSW